MISKFTREKSEKTKKSKGTKIREEKGITLIALVVTIIVLLILAGISIQMLMGDNGILGTAEKTVDTYQIESEREALQMSVETYKLGKSTGSEESKLGKDLFDRNSDNGDKWDIVVEEGNEGNPYGTGWNFIEDGTDLEGYGKTKNNWLVNYETGETILLEDQSYRNYNYESTVAVTKDLLFNLESANVGLDESLWGDNTTLYYYNEDQIDNYKKGYEEQRTKYNSVRENNAGYDRQVSTNVSDYIDEETGAFKFSGNNYIELHNETGFDFSNGLTYEFYGNIEGNKYLRIGGGQDRDAFWCGLFGFWSGKYSDQPVIRFGYNFEISSLWYSFGNFGGDMAPYGSWDYGEWPWNQVRKIEDLTNKEIYFTLTLKPNSDGNVDQTIYIDGNERESGWLTKLYYDKFLTSVRNLNYLEVGRCTMGGGRKLGLPSWSKLCNKII